MIRILGGFASWREKSFLSNSSMTSCRIFNPAPPSQVVQIREVKNREDETRAKARRRKEKILCVFARERFF